MAMLELYEYAQALTHLDAHQALDLPVCILYII
jgi:hypothetical protein